MKEAETKLYIIGSSKTIVINFIKDKILFIPYIENWSNKLSLKENKTHSWLLNTRKKQIYIDVAKLILKSEKCIKAS